MASDPEGSDPLPPSLRFLKLLVTVLTVVMIGGLLTMIALFVIRLQPATVPPLPLPDGIVLPEGAKPLSVAWGADHYVVVTEDKRILVFSRAGRLLKTVEIE